MFCSKCGIENEQQASFCKKCGAPTKISPSVIEQPSTTKPSISPTPNPLNTQVPHRSVENSEEIRLIRKEKIFTGVVSLFLGAGAFGLWLILMFAIPYVQLNVVPLLIVAVAGPIFAIINFVSQPGDKDVSELRKKAEDARSKGDIDNAEALEARADRLAVALKDNP
jgi:hypothetical protein